MAYAAITCLIRTIHQSMELTGCDLQPLCEKLESLRAILEKPWKATDNLEALTSLEAEIAELAYSAEDMVDSESREVFLAQNVEERSRAMWELLFVLEQALECIDSTMKQWIATWVRCNNMKDLKAQTYSLASIPEHAVDRFENIMIGHGTEFEMMLEKLLKGERELDVVSIVGMGGIGKTTLATKLYSDPRVMSHFDICAKATVSQEHCVRHVLLGLLSTTSDEPDDELADRLQKLLKIKRYLVVIDDIWTAGAWDDIKLCFPDCSNGSRILLTTRNVEVAEYASSGKPPLHMRLMNFDEGWSLLYEKVFAKDSFPSEFETIGRQIALKCGGLPLAITVIAGLLSKMGKTLDEWRSVAENASLVVSTDLESQCMRVLALSYHHLPSHLKPCFLYFAIFPEDNLISLDRLLELWAVEGFLKVEEMKSIEEVAETCLNQLIDRSLIYISGYSRFDGKVESCGMHDVIREFCLREAQNMNFVTSLGGKSGQNQYAPSVQCPSTSRGRISIHNVEELARYSNSEAHSIIMLGGLMCFALELPFKLVRVLDLDFISIPTFPSEILCLIHLRYLSLSLCARLKIYIGSEVVPSSIDIPPSISSLCYLQTFILRRSKRYRTYFVVKESTLVLPSEIFMLPELRHLCLGYNYLRNPEPTWKSFVLKNLHSLYGWNPRYCTGSFFRLFPNLKTLEICVVRKDYRNRKDLYDFRYLDQLEELIFDLESTEGSIFDKDVVPPLLLAPPDAFPQNLKDLTFSGNFFLTWKDLSIVSKLLKLESLKLEKISGIGEEWEVAEEGFPHLKFLLLSYIPIRYWRANSDHFPCLERLHLKECRMLDSIPQDFADITTLALIDIRDCQESVENSAEQIQRDIQDKYGGSIEVHIRSIFIPRIGL